MENLKLSSKKIIKNAKFSQHPGGLFLAFTLTSQVLFVSRLPRPAVVHQPPYLADLSGFNFYDGDQFVFELVPSLRIYCPSGSRVLG